MLTHEQHRKIINARAIEVLTAQSNSQREGALDRLTMACIDAYGSNNFELRRHVDRALERANPQRRIRL